MRRSGDHFAGLLEADQHSPQRNTAHKIACAIYRIDNPLAAIAARPVCAFFTEDAAVRKFACEALDDQLFASFVGGGDGGLVGLALGGYSAPLVIQRESPSFLREFLRNLYFVFKRHVFSLWLESLLAFSDQLLAFAFL